MNTPTDPTTGFPDSEFAARLSLAQARMADAGLGALLLSTEADLRYFSGYLTRFWESPTRPWYLIVPAGGNVVRTGWLPGADWYANGARIASTNAVGGLAAAAIHRAGAGVWR